VTDSDKHSSLVRYEINYDREKFYDTDPMSRFKLDHFITDYNCSLQALKSSRLQNFFITFTQALRARDLGPML
jgi:hypothetical protein